MQKSTISIDVFKLEAEDLADVTDEARAHGRLEGVRLEVQERVRGFTGYPKVEVTVGERSGVALIGFSESQDQGTIIIGSGVNSTRVDDAFIRITSPSTCEGYAKGGEFCGSPTDYTVYFAAEFNRPAEAFGVWSKGNIR